MRSSRGCEGAVMVAIHSAMDWLLMTSLYAAAVVGVVLMCTASLRKWLTPGARCALWALVAARLLMPVTPSSPWSVYNLLSARQQTPQKVPPQMENARSSDEWIVQKGGLDFQ